MTVSSRNSTMNSPVCAGHLAENTHRQLVDQLVDNGDQNAFMELLATDAELGDDVPELVCGWGNSTSFLKPPDPKKVRKKPAKTFPPDIDTSKITVRCVSDDYNIDNQRAAWKANVEPGTYRYISNNGIYRSTKFANARTDWVTAKRSRHSEPMTNSLELRQAQRTLKKDLSNHFQSQDSPKSQPPTHVQSQSQSQTESQAQPHGQSQNALSMLRRSGIIIKERSSPNLRDASSKADEIPKDMKLVKSASDLFVENFSSRMTAIEKELNESTSNSSKNPTEGVLKPGTSSQIAVKAMSSQSSRRNVDSYPSDSSSKWMVPQSDDISKDVFTIKPVVRSEQPLKPLEKLTPLQKRMDKHSTESERTSNSGSKPDSPNLTSFMTAMTAFTHLHQHHQPHHTCHRDSGHHSHHSKSSPSTFRQHHIHGHSGSGAGTGIGNTSACSSDTDSISSVKNALTATNIDIEKMRMFSSTNQLNTKDYGRFVTNKPKMTFASSGQTQTVAALAKPFGGHRKGVVGYRAPGMSSSPSIPFTLNTTGCGISGNGTISSSNAPSVSEMSSSESVVSSVFSKALRESKVGLGSSLSLPEISGKRLSVNSTTQRML